MINRFLAGKKKYSVFIATFLVAAIEMLTTDPDTQKELLDFVPVLAMVLSGVTYIIIEGLRDWQREKTETARASQTARISSQVFGGTYTTQTAENAPPAQSQTAESAPPAPVDKPAEFDVKAFHARVLSDVEANYTEVNPATIFYQARDRGSVTTAENIQQVLDYWDYLVTLAYDASAYVREVTTSQSDPCRRTSPESLLAQRELTKALRCRDSAYQLAKTNVDWKRRLAPYDTLYHVGAMAEGLL